MVARERFELSSRAPEALMLDRYTTGLRYFGSGFLIITLVLGFKNRGKLFVGFVFQGFFYAVAFLAAWVPVFATP